MRRLSAVALFFGLTFLSSLALGATSEYEGKTVVAVRYDPPAQPVLERDLQRFVIVKAGQPLHIADVTQSIENLYGSGRYLNIVAEAEPEGDGVIVRFVTKNTYFVNRVVVTGVSSPPNRGQLENATKLSLGTEFLEPQRQQAIENIQDLLRRNGLYRAQVTSEEKRNDETEQIDLFFTVKQGKRAKYEEPTVKGHPGRSIGSIVRTTRWQRFYGLFGWRMVYESTTQTGLDRLRGWYQSHDRLLGSVNLDSMSYDDKDNRVKPLLTMEEGPKVTVRAKGAKVRRGTLEQLVPIFQEQAVDQDLIREGENNLRDFFQAKGYFDADVTSETEHPDANEESVLFYIDRGSRYRLVELQITGNKYFTTETIRERMNVQPATFLRYRHGRYSEALLTRDITAIKDLYKNNGFRDVDILSRVEDNHNGTATDLAVYLTIKEGRQYTVSHLALVGIDPPDAEYLHTLFTSSEGQPYSDFNVATDQEEILNYYFNNGYPDATFTAKSDARQGSAQVALTYTVNKGRRQFVRKVLISGLQSTRPGLVKSKIALQDGDPLSQSKQIDAQRKLYDLSIFARVDTALQNPDADEDYKYVLYRVEEAHKYTMNVGVGAEIARIGGGVNLNNPGGAAGFSPRGSFGISRINLFGRAQTVSLQTRVSNLQQRVLLTYLIPQFIGNPNLNVTVSAIYDNSRDVRTFTAKREEASFQVGQRFTKANSAQYRFSYRKVSTTDVAITPELVPLLAQPVRIGMVSTSFFQDRRDDPIDSHRGVYNTIDVGLAGSFFGSQTNFSRLLMRDSTYRPFGRDYVLARTTFFGFLRQYGGGVDIPLVERLFGGGATSHRGFPENQAGPRDPETGFPIGGKAILINSVELRFPLIGDNIGGAVFWDAGNVYSDLSSISFRFHQQNLQDFNYMVHAVGYGIRYRTPIGPIRLDLAYTINPPSFIGCRGSLNDLLYNCNPGNPASAQFITQQAISHFQFHFNLGQAF